MDGPCCSVLVSRLLPGWALPQVGMGSLEVIPAVGGMPLLRPCYLVVTLVPNVDLLTSVCGLISRRSYIIALDVNTGKTARGGILLPLANERRCKTVQRFTH